MSRMIVPTAGILAGLVAAGCATDDPRQGGFFGGLAGLGSGAYGERVAAEEAALDAEKMRHQEEVDDGEQLDDTLRHRQSHAIELEHQALLMRQEIDDLDAEIATLEREETVTQDQVEQAEADVASLLDDIDRIEAERAAHEQAKSLGADAGSSADPAEFGEPPREQVSDLRAYIIKLQEAVDALKATREQRADEPETTSDNEIN